MRRRVRKGISVTFHGGIWQHVSVVVPEGKGDSSVGGEVWLLEFQVRQRRYKLFHGLGRYRDVRSEPRVSPVRRISRRA